jgi:hypothetical protein
MVWTCKYASNHNYSPLDRRLDDHALTTHTYQSVEVFDPYITTQLDVKNKQDPQVSLLISHLRVLIWAKGCDHWHTYRNKFQIFNTFRKQTLLFSNTRTMCLMLNSALVPAVTEPTKL